MRVQSIRNSVAGMVLVMLGAAGCAAPRSDFVVALPNGYQIVRGGKAEEPMIVKRSGGTVIPGPVARYTVVRDVVVGVVEAPESGQKTSAADPKASGSEQKPSEQKPSEQKPSEQKPSEQKPSEQKPSEQKPSEQTRSEQTSYFVINTRTGDIGKNLAESDYNERLKALNIASPPALSPPVLPK